MSYSLLNSISSIVSNHEQDVKIQISEFLNVPLTEVDDLIKKALKLIGTSTLIGWEIGHAIGGTEGALYGAGVGAVIGFVIVVGSCIYKVYISKSKEIGLIPL